MLEGIFIGFTIMFGGVAIFAAVSALLARDWSSPALWWLVGMVSIQAGALVYELRKDRRGGPRRY